jgi:hypothetical protein
MQTSIYLMLAVGRALLEGRIEGNAYQLQTQLQRGAVEDAAEKTAIRVSAVGVHRPDGGIADDVTLNWIIGSVLGLALARPTPIDMPSGWVVSNPEALEALPADATHAQLLDVLEDLEREYGITGDTPIDGFPKLFDGQAMSFREVVMGGHISPVLVDITGQAVDDAVIFPAQYGSPDMRTDGWYWSATVDTNKVGRHQCDLHIQLFRPRIEDSTIVWDPEVHVLTMDLVVGQITQVNGFTGAGIGYLPIAEPRIVEADHV